MEDETEWSLKANAQVDADEDTDIEFGEIDELDNDVKATIKNKTAVDIKSAVR
jgi:hypothetical protein